MSPLFKHNGKLLVVDGKLAINQNCCCNNCYCFEKTFTAYGSDGLPYECVANLCAPSPPEEEEGWTQVGGPYNCNFCEDCGEADCLGYTEWQIIDTSEYLYAKGPISYSAGLLPYAPPATPTLGVLIDLPNPFIPLFYGSAGDKNFILQAYCGGVTWHNLETWNGSISVCDGFEARYPSQYLPGSWGPQGDCARPINNNGDYVCDVDGTSSSDCPLLVPGDPGDGQEWRDPDHTQGVEFISTVNGDWTNLNNWQDANGNSPARSLPDANSVVIIRSPVYNILNIDSTFLTQVKEMTIVAGGEISTTAIQTEKLTVNGGKIGTGGCDTIGFILVTGSDIDSCVFDGGLIDQGIVNAPNTTVIFKNNSMVISDFAVSYTNCSGKGIIFETGSVNNGSILSTSEGGLPIVFEDTTINNRQAEGPVVEFKGNSINNGNAFYNTFFYNTSSNNGTCSRGVFNDDSTNNIGGTVFDVATFKDRSINKGTVDSQFSQETMLFTGSSLNDNTGSVLGSADFTENSINRGNISITATFTDDSCNDNGTAFQFIPDPPPAC